MKERRVQDYSQLPTYAFGSASPIWWGTLGFVALEGTGFALAVGAYLYLWQANEQWPLNAPELSHWPGTVMLIALVASIVPNILIDKEARKENLARVQLWLVVMSLVGLVTLGIRAWEFTSLNIRWDANAYGSIVWFILGLHTTHLITDIGDTVVLTALMFTRHATGKRFSDVSDNAFYWYFVVGSWVPLYVLLYWMPRL
ncbi:MAG: cytochrome c oxidase subunit [Variibacter sp.]|nr:cytochrome c oxidase subunit [Variibacter sp.]